MQFIINSYIGIKHLKIFIILFLIFNRFELSDGSNMLRYIIYMCVCVFQKGLGLQSVRRKMVVELYYYKTITILSY